MISIVDFMGFEPESDSDRSDIYDQDDDYYEDYEDNDDRNTGLLNRGRNKALSVRKAVQAVCVSHLENEPFPMTIIPFGRQTVPDPFITDNIDKKSPEQSQDQYIRPTVAATDVWEVETGYSENHFPWRRYVIARSDGSIWTPEDHERSWIPAHTTEKKTDDPTEISCSWETGQLQKALDIVPKPIVLSSSPPAMTNAWDRPLLSSPHSPPKNSYRSDQIKESHTHRHAPSARLSILRPSARPHLASVESNPYQKPRVLPPSIHRNASHSSVVSNSDRNGHTRSHPPRPDLPRTPHARDRHRETSPASRPRSESNRRSQPMSSTDPRPDLLCRFINTPQHVARDQCMRSHSLEEWKLRHCRRPNDCRRKDCGFYHPDRESVRQFLERLCKIEGTFYGSHAQDFHRIYLSPIGKNRTRK